MMNVPQERPKVSVNLVVDKLQSGEYMKGSKGTLAFYSELRGIDFALGERKALSINLSDIKIPLKNPQLRGSIENIIIIELLRAGQERPVREFAMDDETMRKEGLALISKKL